MWSRHGRNGFAALLGSAVCLVAVEAAVAGPGDESVSLVPAVVAIGQQAGEPVRESTAIKRTETEIEEGLVLAGPYLMRSADPEEPGEVELKFIYGYEREARDEEEHEFEFEFEWGMAEDWEFLLAVPLELGEGTVDGNGDVTLGFHTRFWEEDGLIPAFAMRNLARIPTGYHSDGVDYTGRGLFTWTLIPDTMRLNFNAFLTSFNGNQEENERDFQWGGLIGVDYSVDDHLVLIADYQNKSSEEYGQRNQHLIELGADWEIAEHQTIGLGTFIEIDGDQAGPDFGAAISYIWSIEAPRLDHP